MTAQNIDMPEENESKPLLRIEDLKTYFYTEEGEIPAVDGVTLEVPRGKVLSIVGESGCGKSVTSFSILRLIQKPGKIIGGRILYDREDGKDPVDILSLDEKSEELFQVRGGDISMIFQEPMSALSPVHTIGNQICEAILLHQDVSEEEARRKSIEMLGKVGIPNPESRIEQFPHELSGGMRQRVVIAMALVCEPGLLIADEPTTALDVTIQAQILRLIKEMQEADGTSVLFITHDLGVVAQISDEVAVMYLGRVVEQGSVREVLKDPMHPYTAALLKSLPSLEAPGTRLPAIKGSVPSLKSIPPGCPFHPRCPHAVAGVCDQGGRPPLETLEGSRKVACVRAEEIRGKLNLPEEVKS
jgi:oligopeptide/dipeptide ABC transporter ATP-binding protein